ncbi:MAG TPA: hypothetical protein VMR33_22690 [Candidatus Baltobacteraceae bacterium]|jgi:hypothetical protein|nr:hypothetical protein [Candidatus Baltobacteraceae bacterium]
MKNFISLAMALALSGTVMAADSTPVDNVKNAARKLAEADNYAWTTTVESSQFQPGPSHGKTEKGGFTYVDFNFQDNTTQAFAKDGKGAIKGDEGWKSLADAAKDDGDGGFNFFRFLAMRMQEYKAPAAEAEDIAGKTKELTQADDVYSGDLTEDGAKSLLMFRGRNGGGPTVSSAKGSVKFWIKDGIITKYQVKLQGTMNFGGDDRDVDRTTTVEVKDVGATKVVVPDEAKAKVG